MPNPTFQFITQPVDGAAEDVNIAVVSVTDANAIRFNLIDAAGLPLMDDRLQRVWNGRAWFSFGNPTAGGMAGIYQVTVRDAGKTVPAILSEPFAVAAVVGIGEPPGIDYPPPVIEPPPVPSESKLVAIHGDFAKAVARQPSMITVVTQDIPSFDWVLVGPDPDWAWIGDPRTVPVSSDGSTDITVTPTQAGDFVKVMHSDDWSVSLDSEPFADNTPKILSVSDELTGAKLGEPVTLTVKTQGLVEQRELTWILVADDTFYTWKEGPFPFALDATGTGQFTVTPTAYGDFVKVVANGALTLNSKPIPKPFIPGEVSGDDLAFVRSWVAPLTVGVNVERDTMIGRDEPYFRRLKNDGHITHVRSFMGTKKDWGWFDANKINLYLDSIGNALKAGLKVQFALTDVVSESDLNDHGYEQLVRRACDLIARRNFDPVSFTVSLWNELAASNNAYANGRHSTFVPIIRNILGPKHVISISASQWGDLFRTQEGSLNICRDKRVLYEWHLYPWTATNQSQVDDAGNKINSWANKCGVVCINGEYAQAGLNDGSGLTSDWFAKIIPVAARSPIAQQRLNYWTVTGGSWYRMNNSNNLELRGDVASALRDADTSIRSQEWWKSQNRK